MFVFYQSFHNLLVVSYHGKESSIEFLLCRGLCLGSGFLRGEILLIRDLLFELRAWRMSTLNVLNLKTAGSYSQEMGNESG